MTRSEVLANCAERDERGEWRVLARDLGAWRCIATSAGYEQASFSVPAATAGGEEDPVALPLIKSPK